LSCSANASLLAATLATALVQASAGAGAEVPETQTKQRNVDGIMDNSFLVEEAYNQEPGVVQHIFNAFYAVDKVAGPDEKLLTLSFTQEWPVFSQTHQFSYTIPYNFRDMGSHSDNGLGDMLLNYRYQAYFNEKNLRAFAPRFSLVLPTGDEKRGFGDHTLGYQVNLPFSTAIGDYWFVHLNTGLTYLPDAGSAGGEDLWHYNLGASAIYAVTRDLHLMLEWVGLWLHVPQETGGRDREFSSIISPGVRKAFNFSNDAQLVLGIAAPIGLTGSAPDAGVFFYLSFEHFFQRKK
jgi:hypothetical protein